MNAIDFLSNQEVKTYIKENIGRDVNQLILNPPKKWKDQIGLIADQILARNKAKKKLSSWVANMDLIFPPPLSIEQASSENTGNYKASLIKGDHLIDLTGGMGIDCLFVGERFKKVTYVEENSQLCKVFEHNANTLQRQVTVENKTASQFLAEFNGNATFYIDPARRDNVKERVFRLEDCSPNIIELLPLLRRASGKVLVKLSPLVDIAALLGSLSNMIELHVVAVKNDCKELLTIIDFTRSPKQTKIICQNLESSDPPFVFFLPDNEHKVFKYGDLASFLYEPNVALLKAGAFDFIPRINGLKKIGKNTHLYTSDKLVEDFPGKTFRILERDGKGQIRSYAKEGKINVITRNYPSSTEKLKKKFKLKDGGIFYLIGFKDKQEKAKLVIAERLDLENRS